MWFKKFFIALFGFFAILILFIAIVRIARGNTTFMGLSDLFNYFESVDFQKPIDNLVRDLNTCNNTFKPIISNLFTWYRYAPTIVLPVLATIELIKFIGFIIILMWDISVLAISYIDIFTKFIQYIIAFEGSPAIIY